MIEVPGEAPLPDLVDELGAAHHDALALGDPAPHDDTGCIERLRAHGTRLEALGIGVPPHQALAVAAAHDSLTGHDDALHGGAVLCGHGHGLPNVDGRRRVLDREVHDVGLPLQRATEPLDGERQRRAVACIRRSILDLSWIELVVDERLDPEALGVDDPEQHVLGLHDLAGCDAGGCHDAIDGRAQYFGFHTGTADDLAPPLQALDLGLGVSDLALGHDAPLGQGPDAVQLRLGDRDLLLDVADLLGNRGPVGLRQSRLDLCEHVAPLDWLTDARKALVGRDDPAAVEALNHAGAVRIGDRRLLRLIAMVL